DAVNLVSVVALDEGSDGGERLGALVADAAGGAGGGRGGDVAPEAERLGAGVADAAGGPEAAGAGHVALEAERFAAAARGRAHTEHALRQQAFVLFEDYFMRPLEGGQHELLRPAVLARALVAEGAVGSEHRAPGRQLAAQERLHGRDDGLLRG